MFLWRLKTNTRKQILLLVKKKEPYVPQPEVRRHTGFIGIGFGVGISVTFFVCTILETMSRFILGLHLYIIGTCLRADFGGFLAQLSYAQDEL